MAYPSPRSVIPDSGPIEVVIDEEGGIARYDEFLRELQDLARSEQWQLPALLDAFVTQKKRLPHSFWSKGLLRLAEAKSEQDPFVFFEAFLARATPELLKLLYTTRDYFGYTILHMAVHRENPRLARILSHGCVAFGYSSGQIPESETEKESLYRTRWVMDFIHARTYRGTTALHLAVCMGDAFTVEHLALLYDELQIPTYLVWNFLDKSWMTPLHYAVLLKHEGIVAKLLQCKAYARHINVGDWSMRTPLHLACSSKIDGAHNDEESLRIIELLLGSPDVDVNALDCCRFTPLHWAVYVRSIDVVKMILMKSEERTIRSTEEDSDGRTVLQHALTNFNPLQAFGEEEVQRQYFPVAGEFGLDDSSDEFHRRGKDVERLLLENPGVKGEVERLYRDRQVYVDAANAMLVGAALIASVTFGGWLQAPLGDKSASTFRIDRVFWVFNSLSFFFAIASVMAGAGAVLPMANVYIGDGVKRVRTWLGWTALMLLVSVTCVLGSFAAAGYASGSTKSEPGDRGSRNAEGEEELELNVTVHMTVTTVLGGAVCMVIGLFFIRGLYHIQPGWTQLVMSQERNKSFRIAEQDAKDRYKLWAIWNRWKELGRLAWNSFRGVDSKRKTSMHHQYMYQALRNRAFERALRMASQNDTKFWPWLRKARQEVRKRLQQRVFASFDQAYSIMKKEFDKPEKHEQILQCVHDEFPPGIRKTSQKSSGKAYLNRVDSVQFEDVEEVLEHIVTQMVTRCSGRGLLHIFLDLPTTCCRDICLRSNMMDFRLTPFEGY